MEERELKITLGHLDLLILKYAEAVGTAEAPRRRNDIIKFIKDEFQEQAAIMEIMSQALLKLEKNP